MKKKIKIILSFLFCSVCVFTSVKTHSETIFIEAGNKGISPLNINAVVGDTVIWQKINDGEFQVICGGSYPGTSIPSGSPQINFLLNETQPSYSYILKVKGNYNYKFIFNSFELTGKIYAGAPLPVELNDFVATTIKNEVILDWSTSGEINNDRFEVQRIEITDMIDYNPENLVFNTVGIIEGNGTSNEVHHYKFTDRNLSSGVYLYRLKQIDFNSNFLFHILSDEINIGIPNRFIVNQNYPNPFNPSTKITFEIPEDGNIKVVIYSSKGSELKTLSNSVIRGGYHSIDFNGSDISSGVYFYKIIFSSTNYVKSVTKKMLLLK